MVLEKFVSLFKDKKPEQKQAEDIKDQSSFKINFNADKPEIPDVDDKSKVVLYDWRKLKQLQKK